MKYLVLPSARLTSACALAVAIWVGVLGVLRAGEVPVDARGAFGLLAVIAWGCIETRLGIRAGRGRRQIATNFLISGVLLLLYQAAVHR